MPVERIVLWIVVALAGLWLTAMLFWILLGAVVAGPMMFVPLGVLGVAGYVLWRLYAERRRNDDDDYYENTFEK